MKSRTIIIVIPIILLLGVVGVLYYLNSRPTNKETAQQRAEQREQKAVELTSKVEVFNLVLPCRPDASGGIPVAHADMVLEVPIKYRLKIEQNNSKLRDIISSVFRATSIEDLNADSDLKKIKSRIMANVKTNLDITIEDILFLRFDYDVLEPR